MKATPTTKWSSCTGSWWHLGTNYANRFDVVMVVSVNGVDTSMSVTLFLRTLESTKLQCKGGDAQIQMPVNVLQLVSSWTCLKNLLGTILVFTWLQVPSCVP